MVKTRLQILEQMYDQAHEQSIGEEFLIDGIQSKIITLIKPDEQQMRSKMEMKLVEVNEGHKHLLKSMDRLMDKIKEEQKKNDTLHVESQQPTVQP